ncbi:MAG: transposase [Anaerolineae bacterium]|nr:transposase [Anaerolineae bacterium]
MKLIAQVRLYPMRDQYATLKQTLEQANAACNFISARAFEAQTFHRYGMQKLTYYDAKGRFGLSAQMVIRCLAKVADAYRLDHKVQRVFKPRGSIAYDDRILSWKVERREVSIWTLDGRQTISFGAGERQLELLAARQGETDLVFWNGMFFLLATCEIPEPEPRDVDTALGVDLGVTHIATTSDGDMHTNDVIEANRQRQQKLRSELQARGSLSAKRHLRKLAGRQRRFQKDINHQISKCLVETAQRTNRAITLEDLTGIRTRTRARGAAQRARHSNWSFAQLRQFIDYKARLAGVPIILVDPKYTSQQCAACGHTEKANRRSQTEFLCVSCGHQAHADVNAAINIAHRAEVMPPIVSDATASAGAAPETSPQL